MQIALACVRVNEGINPNCGSRGSSIEHLCMVCIISAVLWGLLLSWSDGWKSCGLCYGHLWVLSRDWLQEEGSWQPKLNVSVLKQLSCHSATQKRWMKNTFVRNCENSVPSKARTWWMSLSTWFWWYRLDSCSKALEDHPQSLAKSVETVETNGVSSNSHC